MYNQAVNLASRFSLSEPVWLTLSPAPPRPAMPRPARHCGCVLHRGVGQLGTPPNDQRHRQTRRGRDFRREPQSRAKHLKAAGTGGSHPHTLCTSSDSTFVKTFVVIGTLCRGFVRPHGSALRAPPRALAESRRAACSNERDTWHVQSRCAIHRGRGRGLLHSLQRPARRPTRSHPHSVSATGGLSRTVRHWGMMPFY